MLDNLKTHKTRLIHDWLVKRPHFHLHFTPTSASWLNLVECWFALLSRRRLERAAFTSTGDLKAAILAYIAETNSKPKPFVWTKPADDLLASVARFCQRTSNSYHSHEVLTDQTAARGVAVAFFSEMLPCPPACRSAPTAMPSSCGGSPAASTMVGSVPGCSRSPTRSTACRAKKLQGSPA